MVLSEDPLAMEKAIGSLADQGVRARPAGQYAVGQSPIAFTVSVLEILPAQKAQRHNDDGSASSEYAKRD